MTAPVYYGRVESIVRLLGWIFRHPVQAADIYRNAHAFGETPPPGA